MWKIEGAIYILDFFLLLKDFGNVWFQRNIWCAVGTVEVTVGEMKNSEVKYFAVFCFVFKTVSVLRLTCLACAGWKVLKSFLLYFERQVLWCHHLGSVPKDGMFKLRGIGRVHGIQLWLGLEGSLGTLYGYCISVLLSLLGPSSACLEFFSCPVIFFRLAPRATLQLQKNQRGFCCLSCLYNI